MMMELQTSVKSQRRHSGERRSRHPTRTILAPIRHNPIAFQDKALQRRQSDRQLHDGTKIASIQIRTGIPSSTVRSQKRCFLTLSERSHAGLLGVFAKSIVVAHC